jgi:cytochrome c5
MKNKTNNPLFGLAFLAIIITVLLASCAPSAASTPDSSAPAATDPGAALMDERCTVCHSASRITSAAMTADEWTSTVDRMIGKGAELSADEKQVLIDYLAANYK